VGVLAFDGEAPERVGSRLAALGLVARIDGVGWALVPDPFAPGRAAELARALGGAAAALGPEVPPSDAPRSARRAELALELVAKPRVAAPTPSSTVRDARRSTVRDARGSTVRDARGSTGREARGSTGREARGSTAPHAGGSAGFVVAQDHLLDLILRRDEEIARELAARRLAPLDVLPATSRARLLETLAAWLDAHGEARPAAAALHVHVQTVRYRLGQLRDLLGDALDDPRARLELALALEVRRARA
jgi:DNA-binding PucR family transcriptional regulator